jgi:Ca-activated chloride channel family protein
MYCEKCETLLPLLALDELDAERKAETEAHVAECPACREKLADLRATLQLLNEAAERLPEARLSGERREALAKASAEEDAKERSGFKLAQRASNFLRPSPAVNWSRVWPIAAAILLSVVAIGLILPALTPARESGRLLGGESNLRQTVDGRVTLQMPNGDFLPVFRMPAPADSAPMASAPVVWSADTADSFSLTGGKAGGMGGKTGTVPAAPGGGPGVAVSRISEEYMARMGDLKGLAKTAEEGKTGANKAIYQSQKALIPAAIYAYPSKEIWEEIKARQEVALASGDAVKTPTAGEQGISPAPALPAPAVSVYAQDAQRMLARANNAERQSNQEVSILAYEEGGGIPNELRGDKGALVAEGTLLATPASSPEEPKHAAKHAGTVAPAAEEALPPPVFKAGPVNPWVMTEQDALSTFALDVDTASYAIARNYIARGSLPPAASVRMEEFVNSFDYNYPSQTSGVFSVHAEAGPSPFRPSLTLLKIGVRAKVLGREARKPAHLVFVVDTSGSMERSDRLPLVKYALRALVDHLGSNDRVSLVSFGTHAMLLLETAPAADKQRILQAVDGLRCAGSTNLFEGLQLGYQLAARAFQPRAINRVILCSDGVSNIGSTDADAMLKGVEDFRKQGVTLTTVGVGYGVYDDTLLERLADRGDGSYVFVDSEAEARRVFVEEMAGTIQAVAKDAKIQVAFDPAVVRRFRLIGFENRAIPDADFRNDNVVAGGVGSGQSSTALYEVELLPRAEGAEGQRDIGAVYVRYRDMDTGRVEEISQRLESNIVRKLTPQEAPRFFLAACAAEFAEILRGSEHAKEGSFKQVAGVLEQAAAQLPLDGRVQELLTLVREADGLPRAQ